MRKVSFFLLLMIGVLVFTACSSVEKTVVEIVPESMIFENGANVLSVYPNYDLKVLKIVLDLDSNIIEAEVGDENYENFLSISNFFQESDVDLTKKDFSVTLKYSNLVEKHLSFMNDDISENFKKFMAFYDEIVFLASADIE